MSHCIMYHAPYTVPNTRIFGPYDLSKAKALLASLKAKLDHGWSNNDIREMTATLHETHLEIAARGVTTRTYVIVPMEARKHLI